MKFHGTMTQDNQGLIHIGGVDVKTLKEQYGTPLYIFDQAYLEDKMTLFQTSFHHAKLKGIVAYASKAFLSIAMAQLINKQGLSIDVSSGGELYTVYKAGFDMSRVYFHGNNKTDEELKLAIELDCGHIVLDHQSEVETLSTFLKEKKKTMKVYLRVNPGIDVLTHDFIKTSKLDSKFGVGLEEASTKALIHQIAKDNRFEFLGLHAHIGSQIHQTEPFMENMRMLMQHYKQYKEEGIHFSSLNIGGGFGVYYTQEDEPIDLGPFLSHLIEEAYQLSVAYDLNLESIVIEPGRSLVSNAGSTLYTVGGTKKTPIGKEYVFVDGGMSDNPRVALYDAKYEAIIANRNSGALSPYTIAGKLCESGDILSHKAMLHDVEKDDLLLISSTGAYTFSMSSNYNRLVRPGVVFVKNGAHKLVVKRQSMDDLIQGDLPL